MTPPSWPSASRQTPCHHTMPHTQHARNLAALIARCNCCLASVDTHAALVTCVLFTPHNCHTHVPPTPKTINISIRPPTGTLSGNPLAMTAGIKTLEILDRPGSYEYLDKITSRCVRYLFVISGVILVLLFCVTPLCVFQMFERPGGGRQCDDGSRQAQICML